MKKTFLCITESLCCIPESQECNYHLHFNLKPNINSILESMKYNIYEMPNIYY